MRHLLGNLATYAIAVFLLAGAAVFATVRSSQVVITDEAAVLARYQPEPGAPFRWEALGSGSYKRNCMNCHAEDGAGWDQYPGLANSADLYTAAGGREYMIDLHLYGLTSERWRAPMPPMSHLHDIEMAAVINYVITRFGDGGRFTHADLLRPEDIAARRGAGLSPHEVDRRRPLPSR
ncbi:MAG: cytochrome c [Gemmatimonadetes bacterium]|nr:cytochrome c [Gemmatimonadota bacterium]